MPTKTLPAPIAQNLFDLTLLDGTRKTIAADTFRHPGYQTGTNIDASFTFDFYVCNEIVAHQTQVASFTRVPNPAYKVDRVESNQNAEIVRLREALSEIRASLERRKFSVDVMRTALIGIQIEAELATFGNRKAVLTEIVRIARNAL